jgi:iron complex transport system substrate-binding protein
MEDSLVGISHSCNFPASVLGKPVVTSTLVPFRESSDVIDSFVREHLESNSALYELDLQALEAAAPDVIISQGLCDVCAVSTGDVIAALNSLGSKPKLIDLEPYTLDDVFDDCIRVGTALGQPDLAQSFVYELKRRRDRVAERTAIIPTADRPSIAFLEWLDPPFNGGHWNPELVLLAGGIDLLGAAGKPSSTLSWEQVSASGADAIFIACCGFRKERALEDVQKLALTDHWNNLPAVQAGNVFIADGNAYFSCPGPRLIDGLEIMAHALHPDVHLPSEYGSCDRVTS